MHGAATVVGCAWQLLCNHHTCPFLSGATRDAPVGAEPPSRPQPLLPRRAQGARGTLQGTQQRRQATYSRSLALTRTCMRSHSAIPASEESSGGSPFRTPLGQFLTSKPSKMQVAARQTARVAPAAGEALQRKKWHYRGEVCTCARAGYRMQQAHAAHPSATSHYCASHHPLTAGPRRSRRRPTRRRPSSSSPRATT